MMMTAVIGAAKTEGDANWWHLGTVIFIDVVGIVLIGLHIDGIV